MRPGISGNDTGVNGIALGWQAFLPLSPRSFLQIVCEAFPIQYYQLVKDLIPVPIPLCPFLCYVLTCQIQHLFQGCIIGKHTFCFGHFSELAVESLYDIGCIHDPADIV